MDVLINPVLTNSNILPIKFRIGIDHGYVTIAEVGAAKRFRSRLPIGTTANVASKMLATAGPDELIIGHNVYEMLPSNWQREFTVRRFAPSGWIYRLSGQPYPFHKYVGRWIKPT